jgi:bifunctional non-homologous end joining protein LigD
MKAVSGDLPPNDRTWAAELKWDGMRVLVHVGSNHLIIRSASGRNATASIPELHPLADAVPTHTVLDGEAIVMAGHHPSFRALQHRIHVDNPSPALLSDYPVKMVIFDLLWFDGHDIMTLPWRSRRAALDASLESGPSWLLSTVTQGGPDDLFDVAAAEGLEGVVCKRIDSPYVPGARSPHWRKTKVRPRTDMVIGGWIPGSGALAGTIGSVVVGVATDAGFRCAGAVGSGLTDSDRRWLRQNLVGRPTSPFSDPELVMDRSVGEIDWVEPTVVAEIGFARWDPGYALWQPTFHGVRVDGDPRLTQYRQ